MAQRPLTYFLALGGARVLRVRHRSRAFGRGAMWCIGFKKTDPVDKTPRSCRLTSSTCSNKARSGRKYQTTVTFKKGDRVLIRQAGRKPKMHMPYVITVMWDLSESKKFWIATAIVPCVSRPPRPI